MKRLAWFVVCVALAGCSRPVATKPVEIHVAAAANLTKALTEISRAFEAARHIHVVPSLGATQVLAQQIENGAPFDLMLSADTETPERLVKANLAEAGSLAVFARGQLVVWVPKRPELKKLEDLLRPDVKTIIVANPAAAPYGAAAVESLKKLGIWDKVQKKIVYAPNISAARQFVDTGNGDAGFTALSLVADQSGFFPVDEALHKPLEHALCILRGAKEPAGAREFADYLKSAEGREILQRHGYGLP